MDQQYHQMILEEVNSSGEETWNCPICGRRLHIRWEPRFMKKVLAAGNEDAPHSGGKGSLQMDSRQLSPGDLYDPEQEPAISTEDPSLAPWISWLDEVGFEDLWNKDA